MTHNIPSCIITTKVATDNMNVSLNINVSNLNLNLQSTAKSKLI